MREKENKFLGNLYSWILCGYIILAPVNNALNSYHIYATVVMMALAVLGMGVLCKLTGQQKLGLKSYAAIVIAAVLGIQVLWQKSQGIEAESQWIYTLLVYAMFMTLPENLPMKRLYCAFYYASLAAAAFSVILGLTKGAVFRTANSVDGSLAVICIAIILFAPEDFEKTEKYKLLKIMAFFCSLVVAGFGMSRSRIVLIGVILLFKLLTSGKTVLVSGKVSATVLLAVPLLVMLFFVIIRMDVVQQVIQAVDDRFVDGFESYTRDLEIRAGWSGFRDNEMMGRGWGELAYRTTTGIRIYYNHCMYVAILARGGLLMGIPMLISFLGLIIDSLRSKNMFTSIGLALFFLLGYGNAGVFNYTICSLFIVVIPLLKRGLRKMKEEKLLQQQLLAGELMCPENTGNGEV